MVLGDAERSRYYFDAVTGALLIRINAAARGYRWFFDAVHRWDFSLSLRRRPVWDIFMLPLLLGAAAVSLTGVVIGYRRMMR